HKLKPHFSDWNTEVGFMTSYRLCKRLILALGLLLVASGGAREIPGSAQEPGAGQEVCPAGRRGQIREGLPFPRRDVEELAKVFPQAGYEKDKSSRSSGRDLVTTKVGQIKLKQIPAGTFQMGSPDGAGYFDEYPQHEVRITRPFYLGVTEVTQAQYEAVMGNNPSSFSATGYGKDKVAGQSTGQHPVERVSWLDAVKFCNKLSELEGRRPFYEIAGGTVRVLDWK